VRFSKDKKPTKTIWVQDFLLMESWWKNPGITFTSSQEGFLAGGIYMPESRKSQQDRQEVDYNGDELEKIMKDKKFKKWYKDSRISTS